MLAGIKETDVLIGRILSKLFPLPTAADFIGPRVESGEIRTALDVGCGRSSQLSRFRPRLRTVGIDTFEPSVRTARDAGVHDACVLGNILEPEGIKAALDANGGKKFDLVTLFDVIEHFPKRTGYEVLERCEELSGKYILLLTPNGYLPQGPEFGNEAQRHLSGWFANDFVGLGYSVQGAIGTRYLRGYGAGFKVDAVGMGSLDLLLGGLFRAGTHTAHAFGLLATKDVRGVPARIGARSG